MTKCKTLHKSWNEYWNNNHKFNKIASPVRKTIISYSLSRWIDRYFPKEGVFIDCGSGSSESSVMIRKYKRRLIALDSSQEALIQGQKIKKIDRFVNAQIENMPFGDNSIEGIYNLGVMEHFTPNQLINILDEMHRVLKRNSYCIFFWARYYGLSNIIMKLFRINDNFPTEFTQYKNKKEIEDIVSKSKLTFVKAKPSFLTLLIHEVVICKKP